MSPQDTITAWVEQLRAGNREGAQQLWQNYYGRLTVFARQKLGGRTRLVADEEDVALSALKSFCRGIEDGRFAQIADRQDLWSLLVTITLHKIYRLVRSEGRAKRGGKWSRLEGNVGADPGELLANLAGSEALPEVAAEVAEEFDRLLQMLPDDESRELAILKMEGHMNQEIARRWNKAERTVERKLNLIRQIWGQVEGNDVH